MIFLKANLLILKAQYCLVKRSVSIIFPIKKKADQKSMQNKLRLHFYVSIPQFVSFALTISK